jgi:hypothetical protein
MKDSTGYALIDEHHLYDPHVLLRIDNEDYYVCPLDEVLSADTEEVKIKKVVQLGYGCLTVDHLCHCKPGEVISFKKLPPNRIQSLRYEITEQGIQIIRRAIERMQAGEAIQTDQRIRLSLEEPSTLRIIVPDSHPEFVEEMKTGRKVKIQWRDPVDFDEARPDSTHLTVAEFQFDILFEDGTTTPWSFSCNLFDFEQFEKKSPIRYLPRKTALRRAVVQCGARDVFMLPAYTDMTFTKKGQQVAVTSNGIEIRF